MKMNHKDAEEFVKNRDKDTKWIVMEPEDLHKNFNNEGKTSNEGDKDKTKSFLLSISNMLTLKTSQDQPESMGEQV